MPSLLRPMVFECMHFDSYKLRPGWVTAFAMVALTDKALTRFKFSTRRRTVKIVRFIIHISLEFHVSSPGNLSSSSLKSWPAALTQPFSPAFQIIS